uniref:Uncharacterized protein n=1 Tax=Oryzias sinensis TaxID=183150 RepID=A0A8C7XQF1_9TELE
FQSFDVRPPTSIEGSDTSVYNLNNLIQQLFVSSFSDLEQDGFSKNPFFHGIIAEVPEQLRTKDGESRNPSQPEKKALQKLMQDVSMTCRKRSWSSEELYQQP